MAELSIYGKKVESIFQLLGEKEIDITNSVGYVFSNCNDFLLNFLNRIEIEAPIDISSVEIKLQEIEKDKGITDIEIFLPNEFHIIIEAKKGWEFPTNEQLEKYAKRESFVLSNAKNKKIIVFNKSTVSTELRFSISNLGEIPVKVVSWDDIRKIVSKSTVKNESDIENRLLEQLAIYLDMINKKKNENLVYVVALNREKVENSSLTYLDVVYEHQKYFDVIKNFPSELPNYIAFRFDGKLQSIHHIEKSENFIDPSLHFPIPTQTWEQRILFHLGPPFKPDHEVRTGNKIFRATRVWVNLDDLLTSQTISEALDKR